MGCYPACGLRSIRPTAISEHWSVLYPMRDCFDRIDCVAIFVIGSAELIARCDWTDCELADEMWSVLRWRQMHYYCWTVFANAIDSRFVAVRANYGDDGGRWRFRSLMAKNDADFSVTTEKKQLLMGFKWHFAWRKTSIRILFHTGLESGW